MCDSSANTTTSTTSLPGGLTDVINSASAQALANQRNGNPFAGQPAPVAELNGYQNNAAQTFQGLAGYQAPQVNTGYSTQNVSTDPTYGQVQNYMNPFTAGVINTSLDELNRQLAQTNQTAAGTAARAGAFGGDRAAIVQTENQRNANQIAAQTISGLNSQNYSQALGAAQSDAGRRLQADQGNQSAGLQISNLNAAQERANQAAGLSGAQLRLSAAGQEGNLGAQFRQATQDNLNSNYAAQRGDAYYPTTSLSTLAQQLGLLSSAAPRTTVTTAPGQSTLGQVAGLGTAALGLNSLTGGALTSGASSLFKGLFGSGSGGGSTAADASNAILNGGGASDAFGNALYGPGFASGGAVPFAMGGAADSSTDYPDDGLYVPVPEPDYGGGDMTSGWQRWPGGGDHAPVDPGGDYGGSYRPQPAGLGMTANLNLSAPAPQPMSATLGLLAASPSSADVDQEIETNPAEIVVDGARPQGDPVQTGRERRSQGLAAARASAQSRMAASASPAAPLPTGGFGIGSAAAPMAAQAAPGGPAAAADGNGDWTQNKTGLALLAAGLGMLGSKSHTALGAIGDGGLAGLSQFQTIQRQQNELALRKQRADQLAAYQKASVGIRQQTADTGRQRADQQGDHYAAQEDMTQQRIDQGQQRTDAYVQRSMTQAQKTERPTSASIQQAAIEGYLQANPGKTTADAWTYLKGYASRDANAAARLDLAREKGEQAKERDKNTQEFRDRNQQRLLNNAEDANARSITFANPKVSYDQAVTKARESRVAAGNAPAPSDSPAQGGAGGDPVRVGSPGEAMRLPSGTRFVTPDGKVMVRH